eukprot:g19304.t1
MRGAYGMYNQGLHPGEQEGTGAADKGVEGNDPQNPEAINDLDKGTEGILAEFVDDTKIAGGTGSIEDSERLQKDLDRLGDWTKKWQMEYNIGKYEVMHFDRKNR